MSAKRSPWVVFVAAFVVTTSFSHVVRASPLFEVAGDTLSTGGAHSRVVPAGAGAAYFNPALLVDVPAGVSVGFFILDQRIAIDLMGRLGPQFDIPEGSKEAGHGPPMFNSFESVAIPTTWLSNGYTGSSLGGVPFAARPRQLAGTGHTTTTYEAFGLVIKLFENRASLGLTAMVPNGEFTKLRTFFSDEREQYFSNSLQPELFSDRMTALSIAFGLGIKLTDYLSFGAGLTFSLKAGVDAPVYVANASNLTDILLAMNASVNIGLSPHFGLQLKPTDRLRFTATAHSPQKVELDASFKFLLASGVEQGSGLGYVLDYTPWRVALGAAYDLIKDTAQTFSVLGSVLYANWSSYRSRLDENPGGAYEWSDTFSPSLGARYTTGKISTALDGRFTPTPVPAQTGRTNYVDNDRITGTAGADYSFELLGTSMKLGLQLQVHRLLSRQQIKVPTPTYPDGVNRTPDLVKDELPDDAYLNREPYAQAQGLQTNNPGWPGFSSGGWISGGTVYLTISL